MKLSKIFISILLVLSISIVNAQSPNDTIQIDTKQKMEKNIDSLLNLWYVKNSIKDNSSFKKSVDTISIKNIPDSVYATRLKRLPSIMPLPFNNQVRKYIEFYLVNGKYWTPVLLGLSEYYFPIFEEILDKNGLPHELKYLTIIESALNPRAVSYAGATGLWQIIYPTGKFYNMEINSLVDERRDPIKSTYVGIRYLKDLYEIYNDWPLTLAAYNCGPGVVNRAIKRIKGKADYWSIHSSLPYETRTYVPAFIAVVYIMNYYKEHNIQPIKIPMALNNDTVIVSKKLHLMQVAEVLKMPIDQLRDMNPQFKKDIIPAVGKKYVLKLPMEQAIKFAELSDSIYKYKDSVYLDTKKNFNVVANMATSNKNGGGSSSNTDYDRGAPPSIEGKTQIFYTIKPGDTYGHIATWFNVSINELRYWNEAYSHYLSVGQKIIIYVPNKKIRLYKDVDDMTFDQKQEFAAKAYGISIGSSTPKKVELDKNYVYYTIQPGDNLGSIAQKYPGINEIDIMKINNFSDSDVRKLQIGQAIKIKKK